MMANAPASRQTGPCWRFLFKIRFPGLGAISNRAHFYCPVEDSYCYGSPSFFSCAGQLSHFLAISPRKHCFPILSQMFHDDYLRFGQPLVYPFYPLMPISINVSNSPCSKSILAPYKSFLFKDRAQNSIISAFQPDSSLIFRFFF